MATSCHSNDALIGRWTVDRVNVEFDENKATPEMVRQYGELEKGNVIEISKDSTLIFISGGDTLQGRCSLNGSQLFFEGRTWGCLEDGFIETHMETPLGKVSLVYKKVK